MHPVGIRLMPRPYVKIASLLATALLAASILPASGLAADKTVVTVAYSPTFVFDTNDLAAKWWNSIKDQFDKQFPNAELDRKSTRLNSSHRSLSRMPSSA